MPLIETTLPDKTPLLIEVEARPGLERVGAEDVIKKIEGVIGQAVQTTIELAKEFTTAFRAAAEKIKTDSVSLQIGIKLGAEGSIFVAKASAEANLVVTLVLKP